MAIDYFAMFASMRMGLDVLPETDWSTVPHTREAGYTPVYTTRVYEVATDSWKTLTEASKDVAQMVEEAHWRWPVPVGVFEDEHPVFFVG